jgi:hypothetical protein
MYKVLLALFLTSSLATQVASVSAQFDNQRRFLGGQEQAPGQCRDYSTAFDDDRRSLKPFTVAVQDLTLPHPKLLDVSDPGETLVDFCSSRFPLFNFHTVLLI